MSDRKRARATIFFIYDADLGDNLEEFEDGFKDAVHNWYDDVEVVGVEAEAGDE